MGQQVSRRIAGRLEKGLQQARSQMDREMREEASGSRRVDPNAAIGFTRGATQDPRDEAQAEFMKAREGGGASDHEMSPDLIKFLNDVGPITRTVDQEFTSPRLRESLMSTASATPGGGGEAAPVPRDAQRTVRDMPLLGEEMDHVTRRTTNFSTATVLNERGEHAEFGLTETKLYEMLALDKPNEEFWKELAAAKTTTTTVQDDDVREKELKFEWMNHSRKYLAVPVILKDKDGEYMGVHGRDAQSSDLFRLSLKPATGVKLVLSQLLDRDNEERARHHHHDNTK